MKKSMQQGNITVGDREFKFLNGFLCFRLLAEKQGIQKVSDVEKRLSQVSKNFEKNNASFDDIDFFSDFIIAGIQAANVVNKKDIELPVREEILVDFESVMTSFGEAMSKSQSVESSRKTIPTGGK